jgi:hypothetical protein
MSLRIIGLHRCYVFIKSPWHADDTSNLGSGPFRVGVAEDAAESQNQTNRHNKVSHNSIIVVR